MKFWEAMKLLEEGKKVRSTIWNKNIYIWKNEEGDYVNEENELLGHCIKVYDMNIEWEIYDDGESF